MRHHDRHRVGILLTRDIWPFQTSRSLDPRPTEKRRAASSGRSSAAGQTAPYIWARLASGTASTRASARGSIGSAPLASARPAYNGRLGSDKPVRRERRCFTTLGAIFLSRVPPVSAPRGCASATAVARSRFFVTFEPKDAETVRAAHHMSLVPNGR